MQTTTHFLKSTRATWAAGRAFCALLLLLVVGLSSPQSALAQSPTFYDDDASFTFRPTAGVITSTSYAGRAYTADGGDAPYTTYPLMGTISTTPNRPNPSLGVFDIETGSNSRLFFTGGSLVADPGFKKGGAPAGAITAARLKYRVYPIGANPLPPQKVLVLNNVGPGPAASASTLYKNATSDELLSGLLAGGTYVFEVVYEVDYQSFTAGTPIETFTDPSSSYQINFTVSPPLNTPPGGTTVWISNRNENGAVQDPGSTLGIDEDWNKAGNWSNGVPNEFSDAIIPGHGPTDPVTYRPSLTSSTASYKVRNLTLQNPSTGDRAIVRIQAATLRIYGDLENLAGGLLGGVRGNPEVADPTRNSTLVFAGANQSIKGLTTISDIRIEGTGVKGVVNALEAPNTLVFAPASITAGVLVRTVFDGGFSLNTSKTSIVNLKDSGILLGETNTSYVEGILLADRPIVAGSTQKFGNIGLDYTPDQSSTGNLIVTRTVGIALNGPSGSTARAVERFYGVTGSYPASVTATLVFHYRDTADELNGINESDLALFRTVNNGPPFTPHSGVVDLGANTVTRVGLRGPINTITLGDRTNPLPVQLISFDAVRSGANVAVSWATASEVNNKGFEVQVSTSGTVFRTLAFVASQSSNSQQRLDYRYLDTEPSKVAIRYYRLHQIDLDGKDSYSSVRAVSFDGTASTAATLAAYPNPFTSNVVLSLDRAAAGSAVQVKIIDLAGRTVRQQTLLLDNEAAGSLNDLADLRSGLYMTRITLADGSSRTLRIQKQ